MLAVEWLATHDRHGSIRFDVAAITGVRIEVFEGAF
jgi:Holliday junction resolvase-like predicted endonuclease